MSRGDMVGIVLTTATSRLVKYNTFVTFLTVLSFVYSITRPGRTVGPIFAFVAQITTCFRAMRCLFGVTTVDDVVWENMP